MTTSALPIVAILFALGMSGCYRSHGPSSDAAGIDAGVDVTDAQVDGATLPPGCFPGDEAVLLMGPGTGCWRIDVRGGDSVECPGYDDPFPARPVRIASRVEREERPGIWVVPLRTVEECEIHERRCGSVLIMKRADALCRCATEWYHSSQVYVGSEPYMVNVRPIEGGHEEGYIFLTNSNVIYRVIACIGESPPEI